MRVLSILKALFIMNVHFNFANISLLSSGTDRFSIKMNNFIDVHRSTCSLKPDKSSGLTKPQAWFKDILPTPIKLYKLYINFDQQPSGISRL